MLMAATVLVTLAANAQTSPEAKEIKKMKSLAEVQAAYAAKGAAMSSEDQAFVLNKIAELAAKESTNAAEAAVKAQMTGDQAAITDNQTKEAEFANIALDASAKAFDLNPKAVKTGGKLTGLRQSLINGGLNAFNAQKYPDAQKFFGAFVDVADAKVMAEQKVAKDTIYDQIADYAGRASYFSKDYAALKHYSNIAMKSASSEIAANGVQYYIAGLEDQAKAAAIDTTAFISEVKALYDAFPSNDIVFTKLETLYDESGNKEAAAALIDARLALNPNDFMAYAFKGQAAQNQSKYDEAIEAYEKAVAAKPDFLVVKQNIGVCYYSKALVAIEDNSDNLGNVKPGAKEGIIADLDKAIKVFTEIQEADPNGAQVDAEGILKRINNTKNNVK